MISLDVWIPSTQPYRKYGSLYRVRSHINYVLLHLGIRTRYLLEKTIPSNGKMRNAILVSHFNIYSDSIIHQVLSHSVNKIYYGVTEGLIKNKINGFRIVVPSKYVAEECERINLNYEAIIPHGFDPIQFNINTLKAQSFHDKIAKDKTLFYCLSGYYHLRKGYEELFNAIKIVKQQIGNRFVVYIRTGQNFPFSKALYDLKDVLSVNSAPYKLSNQEIALEMSGCDCYLTPSLAEGFYMPALEAAYGCGKPVVYPNASPYSDYLSEAIGYPVPLVHERIVNRDDFYFFYPHQHSYRMRYWNTDEFADAMISVVENPKEASRKGSKAYANRNEWTIYNTYKNFKNYLNL
jgi:glycosyltransferase involved in cell wall biosynthesis